MNYENATNDDLEVKLAELIGMDSLNALNAPRYCTDWNATMPLAVEYGFDIELPIACLGGIGQITKYIAGDTDIMVDFVIGDNPLRAIVICLIKVLEAKNDAGQK